MKLKITLLSAAVLFCVSAYAQEKAAPKIPAAVMNAFKAKFPRVTNPTWEVEKANEYEVEFKVNNTAQSAKFDKTGKWLETETDIKVTELPAAVRQSIAKQFAGFKITEASKVENLAHGNCYEAEIQKGKESMDVQVSAGGEILSKEIETGEKDDDN
jgi:hypothetical protein